MSFWLCCCFNNHFKNNICRLTLCVFIMEQFVWSCTLKICTPVMLRLMLSPLLLLICQDCWGLSVTATTRDERVMMCFSSLVTKTFGSLTVELFLPVTRSLEHRRVWNCADTERKASPPTTGNKNIPNNLWRLTLHQSDCHNERHPTLSSFEKQRKCSLFN